MHRACIRLDKIKIMVNSLFMHLKLLYDYLKSSVVPKARDNIACFFIIENHNFKQFHCNGK